MGKYLIKLSRRISIKSEKKEYSNINACENMRAPKERRRDLKEHSINRLQN